jgi:hypothetical protein
MSEKKEEEETYSLIFTSLKHPIRRKILRMLADSPMTFSEILEILSIDSGHLSYHMENLGELVTRSSNGKYGLSSVGIAAVKLMSGVEEQPKLFFSSQKTKRALFGDFAKVYMLFLAVALIFASLYFVNFTIVEQSSSNVAGRGTPKIIVSGQPYQYNITMIYKEASLRVSNFAAFDPTSGYYIMTAYKEPEVNIMKENGIYMERYPPVNTITSWTRCYFFFGFDTNDTYDLSIEVYGPDGTVIKEEIQHGEPVRVEGMGLSEITQEGTYIVEFCNLNPTQTSAFIMVRIVWENFKKPYFSLGIMALVATFSYPTILLLNQLTKLSQKNKKKQASPTVKPL